MFYNDTFIAPESEQGRKPEPRKNLYLNFIDVSETFRLFTPSLTGRNICFFSVGMSTQLPFWPVSANVAFLLRRIQWKWAKNIVWIYLHRIRRDRDATFETGRSSTIFASYSSRINVNWEGVCGFFPRWLRLPFPTSLAAKPICQETKNGHWNPPAGIENTGNTNACSLK